MQDKRQFYISGAWVSPRSGTEMDVIDPSTEDACGVIALGGQADTDAAVAAAKAALPGWMHSAPATRLDAVRRVLGCYKDRAGDLAHAISLEMGAPIDLARSSQVGAGEFHIRNFMRAFEQMPLESPLGEHAPDTRIIREAVGVCA